MKCVRCQSENRIGAKFCEQCGIAIPRACSNCGGELSATAKFCADCGQPVAVTESVPDPRAPQSYTPKHLADKILNNRSALGQGNQTLVEAFEKCKSGNGQVVLLVGDAGIGKSRLLMEFRRRIGDEATWCEGRALSFGRAMAFHPLVDMLRRLYRIDETDSEADVIEHVEHAVLALGPELKPALPFLQQLLGVDPGSVAAMDPRLRRAEILDASRRYFLRAAQTHPQVIVFEDLHWID
jgi:hypothetical protein